MNPWAWEQANQQIIGSESPALPQTCLPEKLLILCESQILREKCISLNHPGCLEGE